RSVTECEVEATVNAADDLARGDVFLTVVGTSAEAGDDGEVGRGNRTSGLITPYRPMTMEAAAGKNPVSHVGKLYNLIAGRIAGAIVGEVTGVTEATCLLVSRIGSPVDEPDVAHVTLAPAPKVATEQVQAEVHRIVCDQLEGLPALREELLLGQLLLY